MANVFIDESKEVVTQLAVHMMISHIVYALSTALCRLDGFLNK